MLSINGVNLLPSTGEFTYDTIPYLGQRTTEPALSSINRYASAGAGSVTDYTLAMNDLQADYPGCGTVGLVVSWFGNSTDVTACQIYPSTTYINGTFQQASGGSDVWRCSSLTQSSSGLIAIPQVGDAFIYGGTPADQSIVRCIRDLKSRGFRVVFYPFVLMTATGEPWRGRITYNGSDISSAATTAIDNFLGSAEPAQFTQDDTNLTVAYSSPSTDYTYRRMILHYANLCCVAGGVDLFLLGSEFRGLEIVRGPAWTKAGTVSGAAATWDYPFVAGLVQLAIDVRSVFDSAGLTKDTTNLRNLIAYSADWSDWMGYQHPGENGQWPHLDQLYASSDIDLVAFDNYLPLSDWTAADGGIDAQNWLVPAPTGAWPPTAATFNGLGLRGQPTIYNLDYLKANIEGGEKFNWFYNDGNNLGLGLDPSGTDLHVSLPEGDRLTQSRNAGRWAAGNWLGGKGPFLTPPPAEDPPPLGPYATFPALPAPGWSVKLSPLFSTGTGMHVSGREVRTARYAAPRWRLELNYDLLRLAAPESELQAVIGFFEACQGGATSFYVAPPALSPVAGQFIGIGDGATATFPLTVSIGGYPLAPANIGTLTVLYLNGVVVAGGFAVTQTPLAPTVTFAAAPASGVAITADFDWRLLCCFDDDTADLEEFMAELYALQSFRLKTVRS